jgi:hypothetical protein
MKFFIAEQNIGNDATKEQAERLIEILKAKGWDVEYGIKRNVATDVSEFGQEERIQDAFADDFIGWRNNLTRIFHDNFFSNLVLYNNTIGLDNLTATS